MDVDNSGKYMDEIMSDTSDQPMGGEIIDTMNTDLNDAFDQYIAKIKGSLHLYERIYQCPFKTYKEEDYC